jgi:hypothetical protein
MVPVQRQTSALHDATGQSKQRRGKRRPSSKAAAAVADRSNDNVVQAEAPAGDMENNSFMERSDASTTLLSVSNVLDERQLGWQSPRRITVHELPESPDETPICKAVGRSQRRQKQSTERLHTDKESRRYSSEAVKHIIESAELQRGGAKLSPRRQAELADRMSDWGQRQQASIETKRNHELTIAEDALAAPPLVHKSRPKLRPQEWQATASRLSVSVARRPAEADISPKSAKISADTAERMANRLHTKNHRHVARSERMKTPHAMSGRGLWAASSFSFRESGPDLSLNPVEFTGEMTDETVIIPTTETTGEEARTPKTGRRTPSASSSTTSVSVSGTDKWLAARRTVFSRPKIRTELAGLGLAELMRRASAVGIEPSRWQDIRNTDDPSAKVSLIELLLNNESPSARPIAPGSPKLSDSDTLAAKVGKLPPGKAGLAGLLALVGLGPPTGQRCAELAIAMVEKLGLHGPATAVTAHQQDGDRADTWLLSECGFTMVERRKLLKFLDALPFSKFSSDRRNLILHCLRKSKALGNLLTSNSRNRLVEAVRLRSFATGHTLITEGVLAANPSLYIIEEGEVIVTINGSEIERRGAGSWIGDWGLIERGPRATSARALTHVTCLTLSREDFDRLLGPLWKSQIPELIEKKTQLQDHITSAQDLVVPPSQFHAWNGDLDPAEDNLRTAVARTLTGTIEAEKEFNFWSEIVATHPEYIAKQHAADRRWDDDNRRLCEDALETLRDSVPKTIWKARQTILDDGRLSYRFRRRLLTNRILWFVWCSPSEIEDIPVSDLSTNYAYQGLDLTELRAIYICLPNEFSTNEQRVYRHDLRAKLIELTEKEAAGELLERERCHPVNRLQRSSARIVKLRAELTKLKVVELRTRAVAADVHPDVVEAARDNDRPRIALSELLIEKEIEQGRDNGWQWIDHEEPDDGTCIIAGREVEFAPARFGGRVIDISEASAFCANPLIANAQLANGDTIRGNIAVVQRGVCSFVEKALRCQEAGALAVIVVNTDDDLFVIGGAPGEQAVEVPIVVVGNASGRSLLEATRAVLVSLCFVRPEDGDESEEESESSPQNTPQKGEWDEKTEPEPESQWESPKPLMYHDELMAEIQLEARTRLQTVRALSPGRIFRHFAKHGSRMSLEQLDAGLQAVFGDALEVTRAELADILREVGVSSHPPPAPFDPAELQNVVFPTDSLGFVLAERLAASSRQRLLIVAEVKPSSPAAGLLAPGRVLSTAQRRPVAGWSWSHLIESGLLRQRPLVLGFRKLPPPPTSPPPLTSYTLDERCVWKQPFYVEHA